VKHLDCPKCKKKDTVALFGDAVIEYCIDERSKQKVVNNLDEMWLECDECCATTLDGNDFSIALHRKLKEIL